MTLIDDFARYQDRNGLTALNTHGSQGDETQNGALFTMEYLCVLLDSDASQHDKDWEVNRLYDVLGRLEVESGLTVRAPGATEPDSMDNVGALLTFSAMYDCRSFAQRMLEHGESVKCVDIDRIEDRENNFRYYPIAWLLSFGKPPKNYWNTFRPQEFLLRGWFGRSPGFMAYLRFCATGKLTVLGAIAVWIGQFIGCLKDTGDTDARKLPYVAWQLLKHKNWFWRLSYKLWCFILMRQYPRGMQDVYDIYYRDPEHPIRKYAKPYAK